MSQTHKDFLALSHGQEWVSFYESFDKLVQDNLSRSSELLRRAMALPEVADREVQQIRAEMEEKLAAERARHLEVLGALKDDLSTSHRQVSMLARSVGTVIGDLERLSQRVNEAISAAEVGPTAAAAEATDGQSGVQANGAGPAGPAAYAPPAPLASALAAEPPVSAETETQTEPAPVDLNVDDVTSAVEEQQAMLEAAEHQLDQLEAAIDLSVLAEAEESTESESDSESDSESQSGSEASAPATESASAENMSTTDQRPRPHWLSMTRTNGKQ